MILSFGFSLVALGSCSPGPVADQAEVQETGAELVQRLCSACHAVSVNDASSHASAPPFRTLGNAYAIESLAEALAEGIIVGHEDMPVFELTPTQIDAVLAYLEKLQDRSTQ